MEENEETKTPEETNPPAEERASAEETAPERLDTDFIADPGLVALVEAMLFSINKPVTIEKLAEASEAGVIEIEHALTELEKTLTEGQNRGIRLDRAAGGVRLVTRPEFDYPVKRLLGQDGKTKLSMAALETLAIIAYRQPVTAPEIAEIRGVSSASSVRTLLERKLITTAGRKEVVGTPFLYKTTKEFLIHFGLSSPADLPRPEELDAMFGIEPAGPPPPEQAELFPEEGTTAEGDTAREETDVAGEGAEPPGMEAEAESAPTGEPNEEVGEFEEQGDAPPSPEGQT